MSIYYEGVAFRLFSRVGTEKHSINIMAVLKLGSQPQLYHMLTNCNITG